MNLYHVLFELRDDAKALAFAHALELWMDHLKAKGVVRDWRLLRRKLHLTSELHRDFMLEIAAEDMGQLDRAFRLVASRDDDVERLYDPVHAMVERSWVGLYRPFPDPERAERVALL